jgi:hypothetical protein
VVAVQEFEDTEIEPFRLDEMYVPLIRLTSGGPPRADLMVGDEAFHYDRSYPIKGHSAVMPAYVRSLVAAGKKPLIIERSDRFYIYTT